MNGTPVSQREAEAIAPPLEPQYEQSINNLEEVRNRFNGLIMDTSLENF